MAALRRAVALHLKVTRRANFRHSYSRTFHGSSSTQVVKPFLLADIGEGIRECQIIQWFVQPGARVEQFDKLCEVQSDKAATDITSPFDGIVRKLHYEPDDMALVGKPLLDIDIQSEVAPEDELKLGGTSVDTTDTLAPPTETSGEQSTIDPDMIVAATSTPSERNSFATPAVRHMLKQRNMDISDVTGTGKQGRVTKEDVQRHLVSIQSNNTSSASHTSSPTSNIPSRRALTPVQSAMFKTMTRSLDIPHFLYSIDIDMTFLASTRASLNAAHTRDEKLTLLPFIIKAVSMAFTHHPLLNASLDTSSPKPEIVINTAHDFGIAVDTPSGLLVPIIRDISTRSVASIASEIKRLGNLARTGKLAAKDFDGATFTISNIGAIGGGVVAPVIVSPQVAIVGIGRCKIVPTFDEHGKIIAKEQMVLSWSADHRIVDGAECARAAERVKNYLQGPQRWLLELA